EFGPAETWPVAGVGRHGAATPGGGAATPRAVAADGGAGLRRVGAERVSAVALGVPGVQRGAVRRRPGVRGADAACVARGRRRGVTEFTFRGVCAKRKLAHVSAFWKQWLCTLSR